MVKTKPHLFTVHGSRLYGFATEDSDHDSYVVVPEPRGVKLRYAVQTIEGQDDKMVAGLTTFLGFCASSVPQALEAIFSPVAECDELMTAYRANFVINPVTLVQSYTRTARNFADKDTFKMRRHALRLALNMHEGLHSGKINPRLAPSVVMALNGMATMTGDEFTELLESMLNPLTPAW